MNRSDSVFRSIAPGLYRKGCKLNEKAPEVEIPHQIQKIFNEGSVLAVPNDVTELQPFDDVVLGGDYSNLPQGIIDAVKEVFRDYAEEKRGKYLNTITVGTKWMDKEGTVEGDFYMSLGPGEGASEKIQMGLLKQLIKKLKGKAHFSSLRVSPENEAIEAEIRYKLTSKAAATVKEWVRDSGRRDTPELGYDREQ